MSARTRSPGAQLELFARDPHEHLFPYWRQQLLAWCEGVWMWRHHRDTTGWSMATQGLSFARLLFRSSQMSKAEFRRWWLFDRRVRRWNKLQNERS